MIAEIYKSTPESSQFLQFQELHPLSRALTRRKNRNILNMVGYLRYLVAAALVSNTAFAAVGEHLQQFYGVESII